MTVHPLEFMGKTLVKKTIPSLLLLRPNQDQCVVGGDQVKILLYRWKRPLQNAFLYPISIFKLITLFRIGSFIFLGSWFLWGVSSEGTLAGWSFSCQSEARGTPGGCSLNWCKPTKAHKPKAKASEMHLVNLTNPNCVWVTRNKFGFATFNFFQM